jgi:acyl carrier protein
MDNRSLASPTVLERIIGAVARTFMTDPSGLAAETTAQDVDGWDSVAHTMLVLELENEFDVNFEFGETLRAHNLGELAKLVELKARPRQHVSSTIGVSDSAHSKASAAARSTAVVNAFLSVPVEERSAVLRDIFHAIVPTDYRGFFVDQSKAQALQRDETLFEFDGLVNAQSAGFAVEMLPQMYPYLRELEGRGRYLEALDVGSRTGAGAALFAELFMSYHSHLPTYVDSIDIDPTFIEYRWSRWPRLRRNLVGNIFDLAPKSYDFIVCSHTIEHLAEPISFCRQLQLIARDLVFLYCPFDEENPIPGHHTVGNTIVDSLQPVAKHVFRSWWWRPNGVPNDCVFFVLRAR